MELYEEVMTGTFLRRPNRFIAHVETEAGLEICHVKNTGRCAELLPPGARVVLAVSGNPNRKTRCDLVAAYKGDMLVNMDSQAPNRTAGEAMERLFPGLTLLRPETVFGASRLDFYLEQGEKKTFVEVKGVTLENDSVALFPDAPTERGVKHMKELEKVIAAGMNAAVLFVIQMKGVTRFEPNRQTHPAFAEALAHARDAGVQVLAYDCAVTPDSMTLRDPVPVVL